MKPESQTDDFRPSAWEEALIREAEDLSENPRDTSWPRLEALLRRKPSSAPIRMPGKYRQWMLAASLAGLGLLTWILLRPSSQETVLSVQEISEPAPGYYRDYLAAAHVLSGYSPILEGKEPLDTRHTPASSGEDTLRDL